MDRRMQTGGQTTAQMILLLDNYDSFTYNLAQYLGQLGCDVEVRRNDKISIDEIARRRPEKIVISPGPCTPQEAGISVELVERFAGEIPILGVCLGHQAIGAAFGGKIVRAPKLFHGKTSEIIHDGKTIFRDLPQRFTATRYHSLIVERRACPKSSKSPQKPPTAPSWDSAIRNFPSKVCSFTPNPSSRAPECNSSAIFCRCRVTYHCRSARIAAKISIPRHRWPSRRFSSELCW